MIAFLQILAILSISVSGLEFIAGGVNLNPERVMIMIVIPGLLLHIISNKAFYWPVSAYLYCSWIAVVLLSFALSNDVGAHVNGLLITVAPFFFFILFAQKGLAPAGIARAAELFLWIAATSSIAVFTSWSLTGAFPSLIDRGRIMLVAPEPNILGAYIAVFMAIHMSVSKLSLRVVVVHLISIVALLLTQSKGPYLFYFVALMFVLLKKGVLRKTSSFVAILMCLIVISAVGILLTDRISDFYQSALNRPDAINNRIRIIEVAWDRISASPFLGHGPLDFSLVSPDLLSRMGTTNIQNLWIWQIWVALLHDQGAIGLFLFVCFIIISWRSCSRQLKAGSMIHLGYLAAMIVIVGVSQTTTLHLSAIFGMVFGLANGRPPRLDAGNDEL